MFLEDVYNAKLKCIMSWFVNMKWIVVKFEFVIFDVAPSFRFGNLQKCRFDVSNLHQNGCLFVRLQDQYRRQ